MTAAQLKASILDQAIRGKLVPQDPNDEPAEKLLERINKSRVEVEKCRKGRADGGRGATRPTGCNAGRARTPSAPQPITEEEKPFDLPEGWAWVRIDDISLLFCDGDWIESKDQSSSGIRLIQTGNVGEMVFCDKAFRAKYISEATFSKLNCTEIFAGDVLISRLPSPIGRSCLIPDLGQRMITAVDCAIIRLSKLVSAEYFVIATNSSAYYKQLSTDVSGTTRKRISRGNLSKVLIPLPPLAEQKRIGAKVEELLPLVEKYGAAYERKRKLIADLPEKLRKSILQEAIQGKLVPQDPNDEPAEKLLERIYESRVEVEKCRNGRADGGRGATRPTGCNAGRARTPSAPQPITEEEKPFDLPKGWAWVRVGQICTEIVDCPHKTPVKTKCVTPYPCIRTSEIRQGRIKWDTMQYVERSVYVSRVSRLVPKENDLVYAREGSFGDAVLLPSKPKFCLGQRTMLMRPNAMCLLPQYFLLSMISPFMFGQASALNVAGTTNVPHVNVGDAVNFLIPLPPLAEQKRIVAKVEELLADVEKLKGAVK